MQAFARWPALFAAQTAARVAIVASDRFSSANNFCRAAFRQLSAVHARSSNGYNLEIELFLAIHKELISG